MVAFDERIAGDISRKFWRWSILGFFLGFVAYMIISKLFIFFIFRACCITFQKSNRKGWGSKFYYEKT